MRRRTLPPNSAVALHGIWAILLLAFVVAALYFGRTVFIPIALAALITFLLSRLVSRLEKWIGRVASVLLCVIAAFTIIGTVSWIVGQQVVDLAGNLPQYQENITRKIHSLRLPASGTWARLASSVDALQKEVINATPTPSPKEQTTDLRSTKRDASPIPVKIIEGRNVIPQLVQENIAAVFSPIGRAALVFLLVIFMLLKREDLRGRMIRLIGQGRISATTRAMEDAASRVSRYLSMQFLVNACYGICVALGLYFIGLPNAVLWGLLAGVLRFIPYVGPWAGAALPLILSFAISGNWISPVLTIALFILLEVTISNFVEPWLYGASTGVSPVALIISAVFWTWLWGPIGLVLSTPLTVCLAVMGRHAPRLEFLSVLLSEDQPLAPHEEFYFHLLALRGEGAEEFAENFVETHSLQALYEDVLLPATSVVETDAGNGAITADQRTAALQRIHEIVENVSEAIPAKEEEEEPTSGIAPVAGARVLCVPAGGYGDELAGEMLVRLLRRHGFNVQNVPARLKREEFIAKAVEFDPESVCISVVPPSRVSLARNVNDALRSRLVSVKTLVGIWDPSVKKENVIQRLRGSGATEVAVSLSEAVSALVKMTAPIAEKMMAAPIPTDEQSRMAELEGLNLLDTPPEENFDHITSRLTRLFKVPIALLTLVDKDRQWFKSHKGLPQDLQESRSTPRDVSLCGHVVANDDILVVRDLARDPRFANNPFVKERGLRFYAGVPLHGPNGLAIGALCIIDTKPRELSAQEQELLHGIADDVMEDIKRRRVLHDHTPRAVPKS
jgi:predicted PurR-regulated permease PerM/methylmalonyl-CoA mutase cobalamin-binding subunit